MLATYFHIGFLLSLFFNPEGMFLWYGDRLSRLHGIISHITEIFWIKSIYITNRMKVFILHYCLSGRYYWLQPNVDLKLHSHTEYQTQIGCTFTNIRTWSFWLVLVIIIIIIIIWEVVWAATVAELCNGWCTCCKIISTSFGWRRTESTSTLLLRSTRHKNQHRIIPNQIIGLPSEFTFVTNTPQSSI
jgi:hypothetical protein